MKKVIIAFCFVVVLVVCWKVIGLVGALIQWWPPWGEHGPTGHGSGNALVEVSAPEHLPPPPPPKPEPLEITIDDDKYLVKGVEVEGIDELVKMASSVPKEVPLPRVRILRLPTSRYQAEEKLKAALEAVHVDFSGP